MNVVISGDEYRCSLMCICFIIFYSLHLQRTLRNMAPQTHDFHLKNLITAMHHVSLMLPDCSRYGSSSSSCITSDRKCHLPAHRYCINGLIIALNCA